MQKVIIIGAGAIGCYVGGWIQRHGAAEVVFVGRAFVGDLVRQKGLTLSDFAGRSFSIPASNLNFIYEIPTDFDFDYALICVKSQDTPAVAEKLKGCKISPKCVFYSLQNGVRNTTILKDALPVGIKVFAGMVGFGVHLDPETGRFHRGTTQPLVLEQDPDESTISHVTLSQLVQPEIDCHIEPAERMKSIQFSKMLINLNNAVCALSNMPLRRQLGTREFRLVTAAAVTEGLATFRAAGISVCRVGAIHPAISPYVLVLPNWIYSILSLSLVTLKGDVYSSMWEDLHRMRPTEIDFLNGEIQALGIKHGIKTPVNDALIRLIRDCEQKRIPSFSPTELLALTGAEKVIDNVVMRFYRRTVALIFALAVFVFVFL